LEKAKEEKAGRGGCETPYGRQRKFSADARKGKNVNVAWKKGLGSKKNGRGGNFEKKKKKPLEPGRKKKGGGGASYSRVKGERRKVGNQWSIILFQESGPFSPMFGGKRRTLPAPGYEKETSREEGE